MSGTVTILVAGVVGWIEWRELQDPQKEYVRQPSLPYHAILTRPSRSKWEAWRSALDSAGVGFSDTMLITMLALVLPTLWGMRCDVSAYHYDLVCSLALCSCACFLCPLFVAHRYFATKRTGVSYVLCGVRIALIALTYGLSWYLLTQRAGSKIFPTYIPEDEEMHATGLVLPAACFLDHPALSNVDDYGNFTSTPQWLIAHTGRNSATSFANSTGPIPASRQLFNNFSSDDTRSPIVDVVLLGILTVLIVIHVGLSWWSVAHHRSRDADHAVWKKGILVARVVSLLVAAGVAIFALVRFWLLRSWMNDSSWLAGDRGEMSWGSFGQYMPLILLILPGLTVLEAAAEPGPEAQPDFYPDESKMY